MATEKLVGYFTPEEANEVLRAVRLLESSGFMLRAGNQRQYNAPPNTPIYAYNVSGEEIPKFACVQAVGTRVIDNQVYVDVDKPADNDGQAGPFYLNLFSAIAAAGGGEDDPPPYGIVTAGPHANALSSELPAGTPMQPVVDAWTLEEGGSIFNMIGPVSLLGGTVQKVRFNQGGGAAKIVQFEITAFGGGDTATATVTEIPCGSSGFPGAEEGGSIEVRDTMGCLSLDAGLKGWAAWVEEVEEDSGSASASDAGCYWSIFSLCC